MVNLLECVEIRTKEGTEFGVIFLLNDLEHGFGVEAFANELTVFNLGFGTSDAAHLLAVEVYQALIGCFKQTLKDVFDTLSGQDTERLAHHYYQLLCQRVSRELSHANYLNTNHEQATRLLTDFLSVWSDVDPDVLPSEFEEEVLQFNEEEALVGDVSGTFLKDIPIKTPFEQELCSVLLYEDKEDQVYSVLLESDGELRMVLSFEPTLACLAHNLHRALAHCAQQTCHEVYQLSADESNGVLEAYFWTFMKQRVKDQLDGDPTPNPVNRIQQTPMKRLFQFIEQWSPQNMTLLLNRRMRF